VKGATRAVRAGIDKVWIREAFVTVRLNAVHENWMPFELGVGLGGVRSNVVVSDARAVDAE